MFVHLVFRNYSRGYSRLLFTCFVTTNVQPIVSRDSVDTQDSLGARSLLLFEPRQASKGILSIVIGQAASIVLSQFRRVSAKIDLSDGVK